jgi:hypothetical protein
VKLRVVNVVVLFLLGAVAGLIGDHSHVATGITEYFTDVVPFVWSSPFWFPVLVGRGNRVVGGATALVASAASRADGPPRAGRSGCGRRHVLPDCSAYTGPVVLVTVLIAASATLVWCVLGDAPSVVCGVLAAVIGPVVEILLVAMGVFRYADVTDGLLGVAPFLVPLYFAFGVVAALLGELSSGARRAASSA